MTLAFPSFQTVSIPSPAMRFEKEEMLVVEASVEGSGDREGWLAFKKGEIIAIEEQVDASRWKGTILQTEESGFFDPQATQLCSPSDLQLTDSQLENLVAFYQRRQAASAKVQQQQHQQQSPSSPSSPSPPSPSKVSSPSPSSNPRFGPSQAQMALKGDEELIPLKSGSPTPASGLGTSPRAHSRTSSLNTIKHAASEVSITSSFSSGSASTLSLGSSFSSSSFSLASSTRSESLNRVTGQFFRASSLEFTPEEGEGEGEGGLDPRMRRSSAVGVAGERRGPWQHKQQPQHRRGLVLAESYNREGFLDRKRSTSLPPLSARSAASRSEPSSPTLSPSNSGTLSSPPQSPRSPRFSKRPQGAPPPLSRANSGPMIIPSSVAPAANPRLFSNDNVSQEVIDRKMRCLERFEFARAKREQMLTRRHSSPIVSPDNLFAIEEDTSEAEVEEAARQHQQQPDAGGNAPDASTTPSPSLASSSSSLNLNLPQTEGSKRFQRRANSMNLTPTLDGIDETEEEGTKDKPRYRRRSISDPSLPGTLPSMFKGKSRLSQVFFPDETPDQKKRRNLATFFKSIRKIGSKSKPA